LILLEETVKNSMKSGELYAHNKAVNRYLFCGELHLVNALHIGSGWGDASTDALVVMDSQGRPLIPGSSLRGAMRSRVERFLAGMFEINASPYWACQLYESQLPDQRTCLGNLSNPRSKEAYKNLLENEPTIGPEETWRRIASGLCDACRLFGAGTFWASKVRFTDLSIQSNPQRPIEVRHGAGIHRDTGTAAPAFKYERQVIEAGAIFKFEAVAENLDKVDRALLALGLGELQRGELPLGGGTSRGLGKCELRNAKVYSVDFKDPLKLKNYLTQSELEKRYHQENLEPFVKREIETLFAATGG